MELYQIRYFLALCETLNFARAAERCGVSSPSLTRAVQKLEQELGGLLIRRERRLTHLTELGRLVRPMLAEVLAHAEGTKTAANRFLSNREKPLRVGIMPSVGPLYLAPFLARFGALHPGIELAFAEGEAARLEELLLSGDLDVAVAAGLGPTNGRLRHHRLYRESVVVVFPLGHRFERQESVRLADLKHESLLLRPNCVKRALLLESCRTQGFEPRIVSCEREDSIQMMVAAGRGVTIMPENLHLGHGTSARQLIEPALNREVSLVTVAGRPHDLPVQHFIRAIRAYRWDDKTSRANDGQYRCRLSSKVFSVGNAPRPRARAGERTADSRPNPEVSGDRQIDDRAASSDTDRLCLDGGGRDALSTAPDLGTAHGEPTALKRSKVD